MRRVFTVAAGAIVCLAAGGAWNDVDIKSRPVVQERVVSVGGEAASFLPPGKKWKLVWHDEFNGPEIDKTKWMCRESFWGADFPAFAHDFKGVEMTGGTVKLHLMREGDQFSSPQLQTGSLTYDIPRDSKGFWPFGRYRRPLFMHKYGYYEIRCRQPKYGGWHSAFWLQAPGVGSSSNPGTCGVETDVMENYRQHKDGKIVGGNGWNGYGADSKWYGHFAWDYEECEDGWCYYGVDWTPKGYTFYANGKKVGEQNSPVSHVEQFILVSTEPRGYRNVGGNDGGLSKGSREWGRPDPALFAAVLPDFFEVDFVRVYDEVASGETLKVGRDAQAEFRSSGVRLRFEGFLPGWKTVRSAGERVRGDGAVPFAMDWGTAKGRGYASFVQLPGGKVSARWFMAVDKPVKIEQLFVGASLPLDRFVGGSYEFDGRSSPFPKPGASFQFGHARGVGKVALVGGDGKSRCELALDRPHDVFIQDNSGLGGGFELRVKVAAAELSPGEIQCLGATLSSSEGLELSTPGPFKVVAGRDWVPVRPSAEVRPGSALDFTSVCGVDAPAGKYGRVVVRNGHFEFEKRPGVAQRFYGVNLCFGANYGQTKQEADAFAKRLARLGYNAVRIHHHDGILAGGSKDGTAVNPRSMAELDALAAALFEQGIYVTTDLYVSRRVPYRECGVDKDGGFEMGEFKSAVRTNPLAEANLARFAKEWLTHVNPYTGRRWADEPGIVGISLVNENCPDNSVRLSPAETEAAKASEDGFFARMKRTVRDDIGSAIPLTDLNGWSTSPVWESCRRKFDYVDMHFYVDHPKFLETPWRLPSSCGNSNPLRGATPHGVSGAERCRVPGMPFTITEWNFAAPGRFRCVGGVVTGAWAAQHDWDGLWRFAWSHDLEGVKTPDRKAMGYFDMSGDPLLLASERATMCLFLRRDLASGDAKALAVDGKRGTMVIDTPRTCGFFAEGGRMRAGCLAADCGDVPATIWASSLDGRPLADSSRILLTHLTNVQNTDTAYEDDSMCVLTDWGGLPHLMRNGRARVEMALAPGKFEVFALDGDGSRRRQTPSAIRNGRLAFTADVAADPAAATYMYEIVRTK